ncbi:MAG: pitrilysin family protein [Vicinamibacterales bacterium]
MLRTFRWFASAATVAAGVTAVVLAQAPRVTFSDTRLDNGLRVIIAEDHSAPVFAVAVNYNVGSRDERQGRTGFAHLFEHMMFKGSEQVGPGEHFTLIFNNGGSMNGTTNKDRTLYYEVLPSNQLDLALFLEADRMWSLEITRENLDNQRNAVQEERRLGVDNQPYGHTSEVLDELAYDTFAYEHSVIGSMADLDAATVDDVKAFFRTYYAPNNAVLAIVGDVDTADTLAKVKHYFDRIKRQPAPPEVDMSEPAQTAERRRTLEDPLARLTRIDMAYKVPPGRSPDSEALTVLANILSSGRSSRLYEHVVREKQLASNVSAFKGESRGPGLFQFVGSLLPGKDVAALEQAIEAEIARVQNEPVADWEMEKARNSARRSFISGLGSSLNRAVLLSQYALFYDDPGRINTQADRIAAVTAADVQRVAKQYLVPSRRTVVITVPKAGGAGGGE